MLSWPLTLDNLYCLYYSPTEEINKDSTLCVFYTAVHVVAKIIRHPCQLAFTLLCDVLLCCSNIQLPTTNLQRLSFASNPSASLQRRHFTGVPPQKTEKQTVLCANSVPVERVRCSYCLKPLICPFVYKFVCLCCPSLFADLLWR